MKNFIKEVLRSVGIEVKKYTRLPHQLAWLKGVHIESILDVGANVGQFAEEITAVLPDATIYAFEPLKECFDKLNVAMSGRKNFESFNVAIGDKNESQTIHKSSYSPSSSLLEMGALHKELFPHTKESTPETIQVKRLDDVLTGRDIKKEILIKVDVQGYEDKVIAGGRELFSRARVVIIETSFVPLYDGQLLFDGIYQSLKSLGFSYHGAWQQKRDTTNGQVLFEDSIFVRD